MHRKRLGFLGRSVLRGVGLLAVALSAASCQEELDTTRQAPAKATLGDDIYGVLCDRLGAGSITEDLSGQSYHGICHYDAEGKYRDAVDASVLPAVRGDAAKRARSLSIAKMETLARRRGDVIRALNAAFPDTKIPDPTRDGKTIALHDALMSLGQTLTPLYEENPYDPSAKDALLPQSTKSLGRLFAGIMNSDAARKSLASIWGRQGYRPFQVGLGAVRPALAYPKLRDLAKASVAVLGPDGVAVPELQQLLTVSKRELSTSTPVVAPLPVYQVDAATAQPNRPRTNVEVTTAILVAQDPSFAASPDEPPRYISLRDKRGFVVPIGNNPGAPGTVAAPFADADGDGFADVDAFGRFVDGSGQPAPLPTPFAIPGLETGPTDPFGRPETPLYQYIDTSRALTGSLARNLVPLVDATQYGTPGDPEAFKSEHETLMYALGGTYALFGDREDAQYDYAKDLDANGQPACSGDCLVDYQRFRAEDSPLPDLFHALGQVLADEDSDAILLSLIDLLENHEQVVARLLGAALRVKEIADEHDALAAQGTEPRAELAYETPIWDEMAEVLARVTDRPGLTTKLIQALADDGIVTPHGTSKHMGDTIARFVEMRDELTYDQQNINGPAENLTDGNGSTADMKHPVDRTQPASGKNRSCMQRSLQAMYDANLVKACNKEGAKVATSFGVDWPLVGDYAECELFQFDNLATFYLDATLPDWHPKKSKLTIKSNVLNALLSFLGQSNGDQLLEDSAGITGLTQHPSPAALNRLVFFGADSSEYPNMPDHDFVNQGSQTNNFVSSSIEPVAPVVCDKKPNGVGHCSNMNDLFRLRDANTLFLWERLGFLDYMQPVVMAFASEACSSDLSVCDQNNVDGELIFLDLMTVLHHHWSGKDHGPECNKSGTAKTNVRYCSEAGVSNYEPLLADAFATDIVPALHEFAVTAAELSKITVQRGADTGQTVTGAEILEKVTKILFDPKYAASVNMVDRQGNKQARWVDGQTRPQLTAFNLFTDALHKIDTRFDAAPDGAERKAQWKRARSQLVDQFLAVDGSGTSAQFKNRGTARTLVSVLKVVREQLNANCPAREAGQSCTWAKKDLADKLEQTMSGPMFAAMMDLQEQIRADEGARRELERFLGYILEAASEGDALQATLASMSDLLQVLADDGSMSPIFQAIATAASPQDDQAGPGCADTTIKMLKAVIDERYDKYHVLDHVLPNLVTPMDDGAGLSPVEVFIDVIADVHRIDASRTDALDDEDYKAIMRSVHEFMTSENRGLEQFYYIVQHRPRQ